MRQGTTAAKSTRCVGRSRSGGAGRRRRASRASLQVGQVDQQHVAGEGRGAHVGRVARADAAQRQDLPQRLPGGDAASRRSGRRRRRSRPSRAGRAARWGAAARRWRGETHGRASMRARSSSWPSGREHQHAARRRSGNSELALALPAAPAPRGVACCRAARCQSPRGQHEVDVAGVSALTSSSSGAARRGPAGRSGSRARGRRGGASRRRAARAVGAQPGQVVQAVRVGQAVVPAVGERQRPGARSASRRAVKSIRSASARAQSIQVIALSWQ